MKHLSIQKVFAVLKENAKNADLKNRKKPSKNLFIKIFFNPFGPFILSVILVAFVNYLQIHRVLGSSISFILPYLFLLWILWYMERKKLLDGVDYFLNIDNNLCIQNSLLLKELTLCNKDALKKVLNILEMRLIKFRFIIGITGIVSLFSAAFKEFSSPLSFLIFDENLPLYLSQIFTILFFLMSYWAYKVYVTYQSFIKSINFVLNHKKAGRYSMAVYRKH